MKKIKTLIGLGIVICLCLALLVLTGCEDINVQPNTNLNNIESVDSVKMESFDWEQKFTEKNQQRLIQANEPPKLERSLERENLARRYEFLNDQNKIFYVYLMSHGKVVAFYTAKGKISSVNSRITQEEQLIVDKECLSRSWSEDRSACYKVVGSPQLDGSYGTNGDGIFFFTTEGAYVEWNAEFLVSDFPLKISTPLELTMEVK